ncbi:MAG: O-antigen ligase family protein [Acidimicrobiales bacterium]
MLARRQGRQPPGLVIACVVAAALVGGGHVAGVPGLLLLIGSLGLCALAVVASAVDPRKAVLYCFAADAFVAATPSVGRGQLKPTDLCLVAAMAILALRPESRSVVDKDGTPRRMVTALLLICAGGLIGSRFAPAHVAASLRLSYTGSPLGPIPAGIADVMRFALGTVGLILVVRAWKPVAAEARTALLAFGWGATVSVLYGAAKGGAQYGRVQGLTTHPVFFGMISAFAVLVAVGLFLSASSSRGRLGAATIALICTAGMLDSGTRSGLLIVGLGLVITLAGMRSFRLTSILVGCGLFGLLLAAVSPSFVTNSPTVSRLNGGGYASISNQARDAAQRDTIALIKVHGITGAGFRYIDSPHNLLLGIIASAGVIGLVGFVMLVVVVTARFLRTPSTDPMAVAVLGGAVAVFAAFSTVNPGWDRWFWMPLALTIVARREARHRPDGGPQRQRRRGGQPEFAAAAARASD